MYMYRGVCMEEQEREALFWEVVESLQKKKKDERRKFEQSLGETKRSRTR